MAPLEHDPDMRVGRVFVDDPGRARMRIFDAGGTPAADRTFDGRGPHLVRPLRMRVVRMQTRDGRVALDPALYALDQELVVDLGRRERRPLFLEQTRESVRIDMAPVLDDAHRPTPRWMPLECMLPIHVPGGRRAARRRET